MPQENVEVVRPQFEAFEHGGLDAVAKFWHPNIEWEAGERIAVAVRNSGRGRASGVRTEGRYYVACSVRDGQIVSGREYETRDQALEAVGLSE